MYLVYLYTFPNGKFYCGITSRSIEERAGAQGQNYKNCPRVYRAIQKYGWSNIEKEILASGLSHDEACELEQQLIADCQLTDEQFGYNLAAGGVSGAKHNQESKDKIAIITKKNWEREDSPYRRPETIQKRRESLLRIAHDPEINARKSKIMKERAQTLEDQLMRSRVRGGKEICQIDLKTGQIIKTFLSAAIARNETGFSDSNILEACYGHRISTGGYGWMFKDDSRTWRQFQQDRKKQETKNRARVKGGYAIDQIDLNSGEILNTYSCASEACRAIGTATNHGYILYQVCRGEKQKAYGFGWQKHREEGEEL